MKSLKKISAFLFAVCLMMLLPSVCVHAAEGTLQFSDPTGKVGEEVTVKVKISTGGAPIGDGFATVSYDKEALEFVSGTNASGSDGTVKLEATGDGTVSDLEYTMVFKPLKEGQTTLEVTDYTSYLFSDETLNLTTGNSTVTVEAGDGTDSKEEADDEGVTPIAAGEGSVEIDGVTYGIYNDFSDALIPDGCSRTTMEYNGETFNAVYQEASGKYFLYLAEGENDPVMALYNEKDHSFSITEMVSLNESSYIFLLGTQDGKGLPSEFKKTKLTVGNLSFPVWQNVEREEFYLVYAMNEDGEESFYQYDTKDETYQRYPVSVNKSEEKKTASTWLDKVKNFVQDQALIILAVAWAVILIFIIAVIVLGVKLRRKNEELDEFYEEQEAIENPGGKRAAVSKKSREQFVGYQDDDSFEEESDEYEDDEDYEEYESDDSYDDYEEDSYDDYDDYDEDPDEDYEDYEDDEESEEYDEYYDDDDDYEDYDDEEYDDEEDVPEYQPKRKSSRGTNNDYDVDFIDL